MIEMNHKTYGLIFGQDALIDLIHYETLSKKINNRGIKNGSKKCVS